MAFTKTLADCEAYLKPGNHVKANTWKGFDPSQHEAAFVQAQRELMVSLGRELEDPDATDVYRDDYAVYEQALYILEMTPARSSPGTSQAKTLADAKENKQLDRTGVMISPMAQRFLALNRLKMVRG